MLEFSDAPYRFFEARPSRPLIRLGRFVNQHIVLPGKNHRIQEIRVEGATDAPRDCFDKGERVVFVINHPSHSDPQLVTEIHRRIGIPSCFMAAYDVFLRGKMSAWCMQKLGNFSIDREGSDRKAMAAAIDTIKEGEFALNIFPEGNVYLTNDRVTPFLDGTAFIALKAQKALGETRVKVVPISLKFTHLTTPRALVTARLQKLGQDSGHSYDSKRPMEAVLGLGAHLISDYLRTHGFADKITMSQESLFDSLKEFVGELVSEVESELSIEAKESAALVDRIRKIRSTIHGLRIDDSEIDNKKIDALADKAILAFRIHGYVTPYLTEHPSIDRYDETVERIAEDFYSHAMPRTGPRRAIAHIHEPLDVQTYLETAGGKLRDAVSTLTSDSENAVQAGIDEINQTNDTPGSQLVEA